MSRINQPINQVKLTNVAVVRCSRAGKRFEIACYRNKVLDYRSGLEKDLSEVLQTDRIFTNVSKGQFAKSADLNKAFGTTDDEAVAKIILDEGKSIQVSDLERNQQLQSTLAQIASWVASNCVHPDNGRPYTVSQIKHALGKNFNVNTHKPLKKQCLDAVKFLKNEISIERAKMELSLKYDAARTAELMAAIDYMEKRVVQEKTKVDEKDMSVLVLQVDPSLYRELDELCKSVGGQLEIVQQVVSVEGDVDLENEMARVQESKSRTAATAAATTTSTTINVNALAEEVDELKLVQPAAVEATSQSETMHVSDNELSEDEDEDNESTEENDDSEEGGEVVFVPKKLGRKNQKKASRKAKKAERRQTHDMATNEAPPNAEDASSTPATTNDGTAPSTTAAAVESSSSSTPGAKSCNTCGGAFMSTAEYRAHFRSDWHRFNQKLKLQGREPVSEEEFRLCDAETFFGSVDT